MKEAIAKTNRKSSEQEQPGESISVFKYQGDVNDFILKAIQFASFNDALILEGRAGIMPL